MGSIEPLTEAHAVFDGEAKIGAEIAISHINEAGGIKSPGGIPREIVVENCGEDADFRIYRRHRNRALPLLIPT